MNQGFSRRWSSLVVLAFVVVSGCHQASKNPGSTSLPPISKPDSPNDEGALQALEAKEVYLQAVDTLKRLTDMTEGDDVTRIIQQYFLIKDQPSPGIEEKRRLIEELEIQKWGNQITEFLGLVRMVFSFAEESFQKQNQPSFEDSAGRIESLRVFVNELVKGVHPGFSSIQPTALQGQATGQGVTIAVFDVFEPELLARQRAHYPRARIEELQSFHDPVSMSHGNSVIDVILALAPEATIVPISADTAAYNQAMRYLLSRADIDIVNMSRAFLKQKDGDGLDTEFAALLTQLIQQKILAKSLGNTGTDLGGNLTDRRLALGLGPVGNLFAYDLKLIQGILEKIQSENISGDLLLFAMNLNPFAEQISFTATIPGSRPDAQQHTLGTPADGIFTWSTDNFESGSSFGAPQLAGLSALLLEVSQKIHADQNRISHYQRVRLSLVGGARTISLGSSDVGLGLVSAEAALALVIQ